LKNSIKLRAIKFPSWKRVKIEKSMLSMMARSLL
jgi:hypothetical protein